jgi:NAD(P)-dependent dehydrogenase (short-subunit alcohol dehydrogenase family)
VRRHRAAGADQHEQITVTHFRPRPGKFAFVIHPGATETERFYQLLEQRSKASGKSVDQLKPDATARDGLRRLGKAEDVSALALFLCSEKARHIQGTAIAVDGGSTIGYY